MQRQESQSENFNHQPISNPNHNKSSNSSNCIASSNTPIVAASSSIAVADKQEAKITSSPNKIPLSVANSTANSSHLLKQTTTAFITDTATCNIINNNLAQAFSHPHNINTNSNNNNININQSSSPTNNNNNNNIVQNKKKTSLSDPQNKLAKASDESLAREHQSHQQICEEPNNNTNQTKVETTPNFCRRRPVSRGSEFIAHQVRSDTIRETRKIHYSHKYAGSSQRMK